MHTFAEALVADGILLIHAEMEETGIIKHLTHLADDISTRLVIIACRGHAAVFLEPCVVAGGKVELGNRLESKRSHLVELLF